MGPSTVVTGVDFTTLPLASTWHSAKPPTPIPTSVDTSKYPFGVNFNNFPIAPGQKRRCAPTLLEEPKYDDEAMDSDEPAVEEMTPALSMRIPPTPGAWCEALQHLSHVHKEAIYGLGDEDRKA